MALTSDRPTTFSRLRESSLIQVRQVLTAPSALTAEASALTLANYPASLAFNFAKLRTVLVAVEFGTFVGSDDVTLEAMFLDSASGATIAWQILASNAGRTPALKPGTLAEVPVWGRKVWFRIHAVTGTPQDLQVLAYPGYLL